jgi:hypothetical protein
MSAESPQRQFRPPMNLDKENISNIPVSTIPKKSVKFANWPQKNIKEPHDNDVLYGRGGGYVMLWLFICIHIRGNFQSSHHPFVSIIM